MTNLDDLRSRYRELRKRRREIPERIRELRTGIRDDSDFRSLRSELHAMDLAVAEALARASASLSAALRAGDTAPSLFDRVLELRDRRDEFKRTVYEPAKELERARCKSLEDRISALEAEAEGLDVEIRELKASYRAIRG